MRKLALLLIVPACLLFTACGISSEYIKADVATFKHLGPKIEEYLTKDAELKKEDRENYLDTLKTWRLRLEKNGGKP